MIRLPSSRRRWRRFAVVVVASVYAVLAVIGVELAAEAIGKLAGGWLVAVLAVGGIVAAAVQIVLERTSAAREAQAPRLQRADEPGREVRRVAELAEKHGVVVVHGLGGWGVSSVATEAARLLARDGEPPVHADAQTQSAQLIWQSAPGRVLVLEHVTRPRQIEWVAAARLDGIVIIASAGPLIPALPGVPRVAVDASDWQLRDRSDDARQLAVLFAQAPVAELPEAALVALTGWNPDRTSDALGELIDCSLVMRVRGRCRIRPEARSLMVPGGAPDAAAAARLIQHYAELAGSATESLPPSQPAADRDDAHRWFRAEQELLLQLLCAAPAGLPPRGAKALWELADALDTWFAHENRADERQAAAEAFDGAADVQGDTAARRVAQLRLSALARPAGRLEDSEQHLAEATRLLTSSRQPGGPQLRTGWAAHHLATGDLARAEDEIFQSQTARPRHDLVGQVTDQLNLVVVLLRRRRLDEAHGQLHRALDHAEAVGDLPGQAQAHELLGVLAALRNSPDLARASWGEAQWRYELLSDDAGRARCLLHLGVVRPGHPSDLDQDRWEARDLLLRSLQLRGNQAVGLGPAVAHLHLAELATLIGRRREVRSHMEHARAALGPWQGRAIRPDEVRAALDRLDALERLERPERRRWR